MKKRLDILVTERGLAESREKAKALIMAGDVYVDQQKADKPGDLYPEEAPIEVRGKGLKYVSRGGLKLEKAMAEFPITLTGLVCMDVGASTGGFTDCMLQNGAKKVYAVDVGYGQLAWSLRTDPRVVNLERTNARYLSAGAGARAHRLLLRRRCPSSPCPSSCPRCAPCFPKTPGRCASSSPSSRRAGRRWGRRAWSGTRRCTRRSSRRSWASPWRTAIPCWGSPSPPVKGPEGEHRVPGLLTAQ